MFKEGDEGQEFYIIEEGEVECLKFTQVDGKDSFISVRTLHESDHFGEIALIKNDKRSLSIRIKSDVCKLLKMDRDTFTRVLGSIEKHLKKDYNKEFDNKFSKPENK